MVVPLRRHMSFAKITLVNLANLWLAVILPRRCVPFAMSKLIFEEVILGTAIRGW
jgi:hypothetical protein